MKALVIGAAKALAVWMVLLIGATVGGLLFFHGTSNTAPDGGPLTAGQALLGVNAMHAILLAVLASQSRLRGWALGATLAVVLWGIGSFMSLIEAVVFNNDLHMSQCVLLSAAGSAVFSDVLAGIAIALLWRGKNAEPAPAVRGLVWKFPLIGVFYVVCYFTAGALIAWQSPAVRAYYAHVQQISFPFLVGVQIARGIGWGLLILLLVRALNGSLWQKAFLAGLALVVFMVPQLLFPNPIMPWPVRSQHMIEITTSNFIFGLLSVLLLLAGAAKASFQPNAETAPSA